MPGGAPEAGGGGRQIPRPQRFGVNSKISYLFKDKLNDQLSMVFEFLSGIIQTRGR